MPKSSKKQINEDEKKLLKVLQTNSGNNIENIAKKCGFSRQKVWRIKKRLEKDKTIWGYNAVVDDDKLDLRKFFLLLKRSGTPFSKGHIDSIIKREIKQEIKKMGIIIDGTSYVHGDFDGVYEIRASDIKQVKKFCEALLDSAEGYISEIKTLEVLFPIEKGGFVNPNIEELKDVFLTD